jgi:hypothetical protein
MHESTNILNVATFVPDVRRARRRVFNKVQFGSWGQLSLKVRNRARAGLIICFFDFNLWFSLPLSIWLSTGWVGLIFHWQAIARMACQTEGAPSDMMSAGKQAPQMTSR